MSKGVVTHLASYLARKRAGVCGEATGTLKDEQLALWEADRGAWSDEVPLNADLAESLPLIPVIDDRLATATTDGHALYFDARFSATLDTASRRYLQAHLLWHCAFGYLLPDDPEHALWHLAWDHEINSLLLQQGYTLPSSSVLFFAKVTRPAHEVYDWLLTHPALEQELPTDRLWQECLTSPSSNSGRRDADFRLGTVDRRLTESWRIHTRMLANDYRCTQHLPEPIAKRLRGL